MSVRIWLALRHEVLAVPLPPSNFTPSDKKSSKPAAAKAILNLRGSAEADFSDHDEAD